MGNDNLRNALSRAGISGEEFAELIDVDPRTVRRWLTGQPPYARHRAKIARALDLTEHELWPEVTPPANAAAGTAWARSDMPQRGTSWTDVGDTDLPDLGISWELLTFAF